jgi:hypothetical protein
MGLDIFEIPVVIDTAQMLFFFIAFFLIGFALLLTLILSKGYQLNATHITVNLAGAVSVMVFFGMALGILVIGMLMSPGYVTVPFAMGEKVDMFITMAVIGFVVAMIATTFLVYTKRGGF